MAVTFDLKVLAEGQLPNSKTTLYTVPGGKTTIVKTILLVNSSAGSRNVNLYVKPGSTSRLISPKNLSMLPGYSAEFEDNISLEAADVIEGSADASASVDYTIYGVEKTP